MTKEEAITKLTNVLNDDIYSWPPELLAAFGMAVEALKGADGDSISRQVVKDALADTSLLEWEQLKKCYPMLEAVDEVPSVETHDKRTETHACDLIDRQAAIDAIIRESTADGAYGYVDTKSSVDLIRKLPSAQPERMSVNLQVEKLSKHQSNFTDLDAQPEQRWIPCSERLPEESDGTVLVCFPDEFPYNNKEPYVNAKHNQRVRIASYSQFSNMWYIDDFNAVSEVRPIAWMPLPEPWKEGEADD